MIVDELKNAILNLSTEGKLVPQKENEDAHQELIKILSDEKENKKYKYVKVIDYPFDIPKTWVWVKLEDICTKITDGTHSTPKYSLNGIPFLSVKDISSGKIKFENTKFIEKEEHDKLYERCNPEYGDILISKVGTTGVPAIVDCYEEFSLFVSVSLLKFNKNKIDNKLLYYFLLSPVVQKQVKDNTRGVGNKNWVLDAIKKTVIPLPPLEEQRRIVNKIEQLFIKLEEIKPIEEELKLMKSTFPSDMRKSILSQAFCGNLLENSVDSDDVSKLELLVKKSNKKYVGIYSDDLPPTWKRFKFKDLFDIVNGFTPLRSNDEFWNKKEIPWFTIEDINLQGRTINHTKQFITKKALGKGSKRLLPPYTVLLCCTASVGEYAITNIPLTTNQQFNGLIIKDELKKYILPMYLFEFVKTLKPKLLSKSGKTTFNFLSTKKLSEFEIPIPPLEEQQRIVDKIEQLLPLCDDIEQLVTGD